MSLEKFINGFLLIYFPFMVIKASLFDFSYGNSLFHLFTWYGDYLKLEKPHFYVGIVWLELLVKWPLCIANFYGLYTNKSRVKTTCLIYGGVSTVTVMVYKRYPTRPFMVFGLITTLKGLLPLSSSDGEKKSRDVILYYAL
ncbi:hypothetical protein MKW92_017210 [Papaver armeniacum]|nr:hypothetical protein MKW92_017210 [Papaver armeniacum]